MTAPADGVRSFLVLWVGQLFSLLGSGLTTFALGVHVYLETGSVTQLGLVYMMAFLPGILFAPFAGALVDRWDRTRTLLVSDCGAMAVTLCLATLLFTGAFEPWHVYVSSGLTSMLVALQIPAFASTVSLLVPKQHFGRANGLMMLAYSTSQIVAPVLAGFLLLSVQIHGILLIDLGTFLVAVITLAVVRVPRPEPSARDGEERRSGGEERTTLLSETGVAWRYVLSRPGFVGLLGFFVVLNFCVGFVDVLITPLVLSFGTSASLGTVLSVGGVGMLLGSALMAVWGGPRRRVHGVLGFSVVLGLGLCAGALRPSVWLVALAAFAFMFSSSVINGNYRSIWQAKVEPALQGRVMSLQNMVATSPLPVAYLLAGPVADGVFEPFMASGSALSGNAALAVGEGPGRGMALLLLVLGAVMVLSAVAGYLYPRLRLLEDELPDAVPDTPVEAGGGRAREDGEARAGRGPLPDGERPGAGGPPTGPAFEGGRQ